VNTQFNNETACIVFFPISTPTETHSMFYQRPCTVGPLTPQAAYRKHFPQRAILISTSNFLMALQLLCSSRFPCNSCIQQVLGAQCSVSPHCNNIHCEHHLCLLKDQFKIVNTPDYRKNTFSLEHKTKPSFLQFPMIFSFTSNS